MTPDGLHVEAAISNDGSQGVVFAEAIAKSSDGMRRSRDMTSKLAPVGKTLVLELIANPPEGQSPRMTDVILVKIYRENQSLLAIKSIPWTVTWTQATTPSLGNTILGKTISSFKEQDYQALEKMAKAWNDQRQRNMHGEWKLQSLKEGLEALMLDWKRDGSREARFAQIKAWRKAFPKSALAAVAEALAWGAYAEEARGPVWRRNLDPMAVTMFEKRMRYAKAALMSVRGFGDNLPLWHELRLHTAIALDAGVQEVQSVFDAAVLKHPRYLPIYLTMLRYWAPPYQSPQDWDQVEKLVVLATQETQESDGESSYAKLYGDIGDEQALEFDLFEDSLADWPTMKRGFDRMVARYPSDANLNGYALYACRAGDRTAFLNLQPRIVGHLVPEVWPSNLPYELCQRRFTVSS